MDETRTWPDLAIGLYDRPAGRGPEMLYEFENFELSEDRSSHEGGVAPLVL